MMKDKIRGFQITTSAVKAYTCSEDIKNEGGGDRLSLPMKGGCMIPTQAKECECGKEAREHFDNGLSCGDEQCDDCFDDMVDKCRSRSW